MASEDDHVHLSRESSNFEEDKTLLQNASKQYDPQPYQFEPCTAENRSTDNTCEHSSRLDCVKLSGGLWPCKVSKRGA